MISLSWNLFIILCFAIATVYGFILQKDRLSVVLFAAYAALVVTNTWGDTIYNIISGRGQLLGQWAANASLFTISAGLFAFLIMLLSLRSGLSAEKGRESVYNSFMMAAVGFFTAGFILSSLISFMPETIREGLISSSRLASLVWKYHLWWIILPAAALVFKSVFKRF